MTPRTLYDIVFIHKKFSSIKQERRDGMNNRFLGILLSAIVLFTGTLLAQHDINDAEGSKDPALFTRMPGYHITRYEESEFDRYEVPITSDYKTEPVEGHVLWISYNPNEGIKKPSGLQIIRNYTNAAAKLGGKKIVEFEDGGIMHVTLKIVKNNTETWVHIDARGDEYNIHMVQKELMQQDVVADASSLAGSIAETGKASVYGIYFDTGKAEIKAESAPALQEIAKLLQANAAMRLYVVGHTDNVGPFDTNVKLSNSRADAVVKELTGKYSIDGSRLKAFGAGPTAPVASNQTEEGRARNRRVELVAQ
jgi:OmpA-OmpF porin, OOP family